MDLLLNCATRQGRDALGEGGRASPSLHELFRYHRTVVIKRVATNVAKNKVQLLHSEKLGKLAWLVHAFSTRHGGASRGYGGNALNLGFTQHDSRAAVERNRELFLKEMGVAN